MDDLIGEAMMYIFGPIIAVFALIAIISMGITKGCDMITGKEKPRVVVVEQVEPPNQTLSHRAGHKAKEVSEDFIRGFFSK